MKRPPRLILCSFASEDYSPSAARLLRQARQFGRFDEVLMIRPRLLEANFRRAHAGQLRLFSRGYGYWMWKPQVVKQALAGMRAGDVGVYCDVGFHLNPQGHDRFDAYVRQCQSSETGILAFQSDTIGSGGTGYPGIWLERQYTKRDAFRFLDLDRPAIADSGQIAASSFFFTTRPNSMEVMETWSDLTSRYPDLVDDTPSVAPNYPDFIEHRHDQSLFSLLCKRAGVATLPVSEFEIDRREGAPARERMVRNPLWAMRDLRRGLSYSLRRRLQAIQPSRRLK